MVDCLPALRAAGAAPPRLVGPASAEMYRALRTFHDATGTRAALVATGALTNIALLLWTYPDVANIADVFLMGGARGVGNTGPVAEFNFQVDPHAAAAVFEAGARGLHVAMVPLEVTHTALVTPAVLRTRGLGAPRDADGGACPAAPAPPAPPPLSPFRLAMRRLLLYFSDTYASTFGFAHPPLHDPCAVLWALCPEAVTCERLRVDVETASPLSAGQSVVDGWKHSGKPPNAAVATVGWCGRGDGVGERGAPAHTHPPTPPLIPPPPQSVDLDCLWRMLGAALAVADEASPLGQAV